MLLLLLLLWLLLLPLPLLPHVFATDRATGRSVVVAAAQVGRHQNRVAQRELATTKLVVPWPYQARGTVAHTPQTPWKLAILPRRVVAQTNFVQIGEPEPRGLAFAQQWC